jgi:DNA-binding SARP family transcriptional activator
MDMPDRVPVPRSRLEVPRAPGLQRARLLTALDGVRSTGLGLVTAPPGAGKTTLMAQWAGTVSVPVAWFRADPRDAAPSRLVERLATALARAGGAAGEYATAVAGARHDGVEALALALERRAPPALLVIDDLHVLAGTAAEADLERFVLLAPPQLSVLLGTRWMPTFNLARTEFPAPVTVTGDDLRFRSWEVEELFRDVYRHPLRPDDAAALVRHTEGWAAAVRLFHLSTLGRSPAERRRAIGALTGRCRYARTYLSGQVLAGLPEWLNQFLRRTSVFEVLTGARCDSLLGCRGGQEALLELERRRTLTSSDDGGATFRSHRVLRHHLEAALYEELGEARTRAWYRRAADVLESDGAHTEAIEARCRADDWDGTRRLLRESGARLAGAPAPGWTDLLPRWLADNDPWVTLAEARALLRDGRLDAAVRAGRRAEAQFGDAVGRELSRDVARSAEAWLPGPRRPVAGWEGVLREGTRRDPAAAAEVAHGLDHPLAPLAEGLARLLSGDRRRAELVLDRCGDDLAADGAPALAARLAVASLAALVQPGPETASVLDAVHLEAERRGLTWLARVAGGVVAARGGTPRDAELARAVAADCDERGDPWGAALVVSASAVAQLRCGHPDAPALEELAARFRALDAGVLEAWARAGHALAAVAADLPEAAVEARAAESVARAAAVGGARAIAYAALACTVEHDREELLDLAASTARTAGLGCRPWSWLGIQRPAPAAAPGAAPPVVPAQRRRWPRGPRLHIACFGRFRLTVEDAEPALTGVRPRARAALRLLALHAGAPVHRELLAAALWADLDPSAAMHNLQVAVSSLRGALEPGHRGRDSRLLIRDGEAYLLVLGEGSHSDLDAFDRAVDDAARQRVAGRDVAAAYALQRALELYRGDVLPEDGPAEWVIGARDRFRLRAAEAATMLAELELRRGDPGAAAAAARRAVHLERWQDGSWRMLIEAYRRAGDVAAAERARRAYEAMLASLDVPGDGPPQRG